MGMGMGRGRGAMRQGRETLFHYSFATLFRCNLQCSAEQKGMSNKNVPFVEFMKRNVAIVNAEKYCCM